MKRRPLPRPRMVRVKLVVLCKELSKRRRGLSEVRYDTPIYVAQAEEGSEFCLRSWVLGLLKGRHPYLFDRELYWADNATKILYRISEKLASFQLQRDACVLQYCYDFSHVFQGIVHVIGE